MEPLGTFEQPEWCYDPLTRIETMEGNMAGKTTKADLVEAIQAIGTMTQKETKELIDALFEEIKTAILGGKTVELRGFGTFEVKMRKGRKHARNPKTGEIVAVEDHGRASFRPGRELKAAAWKVNLQKR
jgi:integration host factor subunit beta